MKSETPQANSEYPPWRDPNCGSCGGSGYTSLGGCYVCQKRAALTPQTEATPRLEDYRNAPSGIGPLADEWKDKPHRVLYDLCALYDSTAAQIAELEDKGASLVRNFVLQTQSDGRLLTEKNMQIATIKAENERLNAAVESQGMVYGTDWRNWKVATERAAALEKALRDCVREMTNAASLLEMYPDDYGDAINAARAALGESK